MGTLSAEEQLDAARVCYAEASFAGAPAFPDCAAILHVITRRAAQHPSRSWHETLRAYSSLWKAPHTARKRFVRGLGGKWPVESERRYAALWAGLRGLVAKWPNVPDPCAKVAPVHWGGTMDAIPADVVRCGAGTANVFFRRGE